MWLTLDDLRCPRCGAFVHPLLDACPTCGAAHPSRRDDAADGPIGAVRLAESPETQQVARELTLRYTMKVNSMGSSVADATLVDAVSHLADALTYLMTGDGIPATDDAALSLHDEGLVAQVRASGALLAEIPLPALLGAAARHGEITLRYAAPPTTPATRLRGGSPGATGPLKLTAANRHGLLASRARDDHFDALARWLGVLAAADAERRWTEVGLAAYLAELGPAGGPTALPAAGFPAASERVAGDAALTAFGAPAVDAASSIQASLVELERLRAAGLVAEGEYADKRREILARL